MAIVVGVALSIAMTTGCGFALIGMGTGAATAIYVMGELPQTYEKDYPKAIRASTEPLGALKIPVA